MAFLKQCNRSRESTHQLSCGPINNLTQGSNPFGFDGDVVVHPWCEFMAAHEPPPTIAVLCFQSNSLCFDGRNVSNPRPIPLASRRVAHRIIIIIRNAQRMYNASRSALGNSTAHTALAVGLMAVVSGFVLHQNCAPKRN